MGKYATFEEELDAIHDALFEEQKYMTMKERLIRAYMSRDRSFDENILYPFNRAAGRRYTKEEYENHLLTNGGWLQVC